MMKRKAIVQPVQEKKRDAAMAKPWTLSRYLMQTQDDQDLPEPGRGALLISLLAKRKEAQTGTLWFRY